MMMHSAANATLNTNATNSATNFQQQQQQKQQFPVDGFNNQVDWLAQQHQSGYGNNNNNNNNVSQLKLQDKMGIDHLLQLMGQVGVSIKAGDFSSQLADNIFVLCQQLKTYGQQLEQTNKTDLNKVFVSLRQACCRDNGQLGTPCRLKMMELVELRAMGWRPNYSHTQYYLNRPEQSGNTPPGSAQSPAQPPTSLSQFNSNSLKAQPFTPSANSAQAQPLNYCVPPPAPPQLSTSQYMQFVSSEPQHAPSAPGYFLIPAGAWPAANQIPMVAPFSMPPSPHMQMGGLARGIAPPLMTPESEWQNRQIGQMAAYLQNAALLSKSQMGTPNSPLLGGARNMNARLMDASNISTKSSKSQQFREEMTIRNCDSGKIMGVKGRRVALVEELSKTVISFQKVETKSKDRVLTITGSNEESIQQARLLIEDTIRRNVSPVRILLGADTSRNGDEGADGEDDDMDDPGISIETSKDGTLKLCCADPEVLQAAQAALSEYLNRAHRSSRVMNPEERELRKERRKSMPLSTTTNGEKTGTDVTSKKESANQEMRRTLVGSTPNLMAEETIALAKVFVGVPPVSSVPNPNTADCQAVRIRYDYPAMMALNHKDNAGDQSIKADLQSHLQENMPEIVRNNE